MEKVYKNDSLLEVIFFLLSFTTIFALREIIGGKSISQLYCVILLLLFYHIIKNKDKILLIGKIYMYALSFGFLLHFMQGSVEINRIGDDLFARLIPILILSIFLSKNKQLNCRLFSIAFLLFYIAECSLAIYEKMTMDHIIHYAEIEDLQATSFEMLDTTEFRSFSLMLHPLYNANTISVCLSFILFKDIKLPQKVILICLGLVALWAFNSRGALIVWAILIVYRLLLFQSNWIYTFLIIGVMYFVIPILLDYIQFTGILGRLSTFDLSDGSSATRLEAFTEFFNQKWTSEDIFIGGRVLNYNGTNVSLENGALLDLGYWGFIVGSIKIIIELVMTYLSVKAYPLKERIFIMISFWGVAFMNNNSYSTWLMAIFVLCLISLKNNFSNESLVYSK